MDHVASLLTAPLPARGLLSPPGYAHPIANLLGQREFVRSLGTDLTIATLERPFWEWRDIDKGHGRVGTRRYVVSNDVAWLGRVARAQERGDGGGGARVRQWQAPGRGDGGVSSVEADAARLAGLVRSHWVIENRLRWALDVTFGEDDSRVRIGHAAENFAFLRRMAINLLRRAPGDKRDGPTVKRRHAMWNLDYLKIVLGLATS